MSTSLRFQAQARKKVNKSLNKKYIPISTLAVKHIVSYMSFFQNNGPRINEHVKVHIF